MQIILKLLALLSLIANTLSETTVDDVLKKAWTAAPNIVQTVDNSDQLLLHMNNTSIGTLAFVKSDETLAIRVQRGWRYVNLGSMVSRSFRPKVHDENKPPQQSQSEQRRNQRPANVRRTTFKPALHNATVQGPALIMAALNVPYKGNIGVKDADFACYKQAREGNVMGTFRAFLASRLQNIASIVNIRDSRFPIINTKGNILYNSWRELFTGEGVPYESSLEIYSFNGKNVMQDNSWPVKAIWHGAAVSGVRDVQANCREWTTSNMTEFGKASTLRRNGLLGQEKYSCNNSFIVLCIQVQRRYS